MRCPRCGGRLLTYNTGEISCINCSHVTKEGDPLPTLHEIDGTPADVTPYLKRPYTVVHGSDLESGESLTEIG